MTPMETAERAPNPRRWRALGFIALAQLMVALDATIVNIALPSTQAGLGMSDTSRQWVLGAYTLAFGSLLLVGGRLADLVGHKRSYLVGLVGFAAASALGGAATSGDVLIAARALQGACGALLTPSALALVTLAFTEERERARAFGIYGAISSSGLAAGLILGGVLTQYLSWRWAFYLSVPCALVAGAGVAALVRRAPADGGPRPRFDVAGALLCTSGLVMVVLALASAQSAGWTAVATVVTAAAALVLLAAFAAVELRVRAPLLPLRVIVQRTRAGVYLAMVFGLIGLFGLFLSLTYYLQVVKGYSPLLAGLGFLPLVASLAVGATLISGRLPRVRSGTLMGAGFLLFVAGTVLLTRLRVDSTYLSLVLPAEILVGLGAGVISARAANLSTAGVRAGDAGVASAVFVTVQQLGGSIGAITLNSIAAGGAAAYLAARGTDAAGVTAMRLAATVHGFASAMWWTAGILASAAVLTAILVDTAGGGRASPPRSQRPPVLIDADATSP